MELINENYGRANMYNVAAIIGWFRSGATYVEIELLSGLNSEMIMRIIKSHIEAYKQPTLLM